MRKWAIIVAVSIGAAVATAEPAPAPAPPPRDLAAQSKAMADIAFLRGRWLGRGERTPPSGARYSYAQTMLVEPKAGGIILAIEGLSLREGSAAAPPGTGSYAVISYDERARKYRFRSFGFGEMIDADAELVGPGVFRWTTAGPLAFRFTVDGSKPGLWSETGERSADRGESWTPTHGLTAYRVETR